VLDRDGVDLHVGEERQQVRAQTPLEIHDALLGQAGATAATFVASSSEPLRRCAMERRDLAHRLELRLGGRLPLAQADLLVPRGQPPLGVFARHTVAGLSHELEDAAAACPVADRPGRAAGDLAVNDGACRLARHGQSPLRANELSDVLDLGASALRAPPRQGLGVERELVNVPCFARASGALALTSDVVDGADVADHVPAAEVADRRRSIARPQRP
jgi:hypothetical protein